MYKKYSDEELLDNLKKVYEKYGYITKNTINEYGKFKDYLYFRRFNSLDSAMKLINIDIEQNKLIKNKECFKGINKKYTKQQLIKKLIKYNNEVGFPTERKFTNNNNLPNYGTYYNEFGSFKNALIISGINIPKEREMYFDREKLSDKEMLSLLKYYTDKKLESNIFLLTNDDIDNINEMPSTTTYVARFGGVINAYNLIGIDYSEYNKQALEKDMIIKYKELAKLIEHTPDSREINEYSQKGLCYGITTYLMHFESVYNLQKICNFVPTSIGKNKTKEEMIDDLKTLKFILNRTPTVYDLKDFDFCAKQLKYLKEFDSYENALNLAGLKSNSKIQYTKQGTKCNSSYDYKMTRILEIHNIKFSKEDYYRDYIINFNKAYRFDYILYIDNVKYFIEIFGITANEKYDIKTNEKIELCKNNNMPLITFYPEDFWCKTYDELYGKLLYEIKTINNKGDDNVWQKLE